MLKNFIIEISKMSFIIADDENYNITIGINRDFINGNYEDFLINGLRDDPKIITWEMVIKKIS